MEPSRPSLWFNHDSADLLICCRNSHGHAAYWWVHSEILIEMSEWMEKHMPPPAKDVSL